MRVETFSTPGSVRLQVQIPSGDVELATADTGETTVEFEARGRDAEEREREARIEVRPRGDGHQVVVEAPNRGLFRRGGDYLVRISAPHGADVRAELASADINARGRYGDVDVDIASGDVEFDHVEREAKIDSASGDVHVGRAGAAKVNSASGDVRVDDVAGRAEVNTASGDIDLRRVVEGEVKVNSASGDVEVGIAKGSRLWVDAQSLSGDTSSELELESGVPVETDEGPLVELRAVTMSGDISVRRA
jgi:Putative adhesin